MRARRGRRGDPSPRAAALALVLLAALPLAAAMAPGAGAQATSPAWTYHTHATLGAELQALADAHPGLARLEPIGTSHGGLALWALTVGNRSDPGLFTMPTLYVDAAHQGHAALAVDAAALFARQVVEGAASDPAVRAQVDRVRLVVVPLVNPDGHARGTAVNGRLVALDRNYPFHWAEHGAGRPGEPTYPGPSAGSERETRATMEALQALRPRAYASLGAGPGTAARPFGHAPGEPVPDEALYARLAPEASAAGLAPAWPEGSGTPCDWAYGVQGVVCVAPLLDQGGPGGTAPVARDEALRRLAPALRLLWHLLATTATWGAHLEGGFEDVQGARGTLRVRNAGAGPAEDLRAAATGARLEAPLPPRLEPGASAAVPVALDGPSHVQVQYRRLAVRTENATAAEGTLDARLAYHTDLVPPRPAPLPALPLLLAGPLAAAFARTRGRAR